MFEFVEAEKAHHKVSEMCRLLRVSRAGFYAWRRRPVCPRNQGDAHLRDLILAIHGRPRRNYARAHTTSRW